MFNLFMSGGPVGMGLITLILICLLLTAWKKSACVREIGAAAPVVGLIWCLVESYIAFGTLQKTPDIAPGVVFGGMKTIALVLIYGLSVYLLSLVIRFFQKAAKK